MQEEADRAATQVHRPAPPGLTASGEPAPLALGGGVRGAACRPRPSRAPRALTASAHPGPRVHQAALLSRPEQHSAFKPVPPFLTPSTPNSIHPSLWAVLIE